MKSLLIIILFTTATNKFCTAQYMQIVSGNTGVYDGVHTNDLLSLSQSEAAGTNNADVTGDPFWNEDWKTAMVYTGEYRILIDKVKLNLYTSDVWYKASDSLIMIAQKSKIKAITFFNGNDTTSILANFVYLKNTEDNKYHYYQFMNEGKAQLVKLNTITINKAPFDPFTGKAEQKYMPKTEYYLFYNSNMPSLKGSNKDAIFAILQPDNSCKEWLDKNKNKLRSTSDILLFLDYFNNK